MTDLFLDILNASFAASWVVLGVVVARPLLKKAPRSLVCALWVLVAIRLLFGGLEAPTSLIPSTEIIPPDSLFDAAPVINSGISSIDNAINPVYSESLRPMPGSSVNPLQVWMAVYANIWVLGIIAMTLWAAFSCLRVRRQVRESVFDGGVYLCDRIESPFIFGLIRPKIYLPSALSGSARAYVISHERSHIARRDHWWKPLGFVLLTVNWFNPIMWLAYTLLCRDIELACDERVIRNLDPQEKKSYSHALLGCSVNSRPISACPLAFGEVGVKQRIKSVLRYQKPAFWIILLAVVLSTVLAVGLLTDPMSPDPEIRWDGTLYIQEGRTRSELPEDALPVGTLRSVLHNHPVPTKYLHPNEDSQAAHLGLEYAGQPLYLAENTLYIEKPGGKGWLPFVPKHSPADAIGLLKGNTQCILYLAGDKVSFTELLPETERTVLRDLLKQAQGQMAPSMDSDPRMAAINYSEDICISIDTLDFDRHAFLTRRESGWLLYYHDAVFAGSTWAFESPELDAMISRYQSEHRFGTELFAPVAADPICLDYHTCTMLDVVLRMGTPSIDYAKGLANSSFEYRHHISYEDSYIHIMCRPFERGAWMNLWYRTTPQPLENGGTHQERITLPNGATGTLSHSGNPECWDQILLDTGHGQLYAVIDGDDWTPAEYQTALHILSTLTLYKNGQNLLTGPNPLGISLQVENPTSRDLRLICTQSGGTEEWSEILTGTQWTLERFEDGTWVNLMPQNADWGEIMYLVNLDSTTTWDIDFRHYCGELTQGRYRIGKTFYGHPQPDDIKSTTYATPQTCYAEFLIP